MGSFTGSGCPSRWYCWTVVQRTDPADACKRGHGALGILGLQPVVVSVPPEVRTARPTEGRTKVLVNREVAAGRDMANPLVSSREGGADLRGTVG